MKNVHRMYDMRNIQDIKENIYITSDEEIRDLRPHKGKWHLEKEQILNKFPDYLTDLSECKLIILTTDQDLIKDGVQAIDDEFLEWFVKNPSCEEVGVKNPLIANISDFGYKIIIPKEEPIQEILENLENQLKKVIKEHPIDVNEDTYWRGVKIGLETAVEVIKFKVW